MDTIVRHWTEDDEVQPKPIQQPRPPLIVGGGGKAGTLGPAVRHADEYNTFGVTPEEFGATTAPRPGLRGGRTRPGFDPVHADDDVRRRHDRAAADTNLRRVEQLVGRNGDPPESWIVGTTDQVAERLRDYAEAGCDGAYLQHLVHEDLETGRADRPRLAPLVADV